MPLQIIIWDVQHGSAAHILTPNGKNIVIDLGAGNATQGAFSPLQYLWRRGVRTIDHLIITHPHLDHIDDILNLEKFRLHVVELPWHLTERDVINSQQVLSDIAEQKVEKYFDLRDQFVEKVHPDNDVLMRRNNGGVEFTTFHPRHSPGQNLNNHSVVTVLEYQGLKILIPGDNEESSWDELFSIPSFKQTIPGTKALVASHHGRQSGYYTPLFNYIQPLITLVSDGRTVDTSATSRYSAKSKGWEVHRRNGPKQMRKCLTTRNDGHIEVLVDKNFRGQTTLKVMID